jgi:hypothetical protein
MGYDCSCSFKYLKFIFMKKRWILIVVGVAGAVSIMGTRTPASRIHADNQVYKTSFLDTVPSKKRDTTSYPPRKDTLPRYNY